MLVSVPLTASLRQARTAPRERAQIGNPESETNWDDLALDQRSEPVEAVRAAEKLLHELPRALRAKADGVRVHHACDEVGQAELGQSDQLQQRLEARARHPLLAAQRAAVAATLAIR